MNRSLPFSPKRLLVAMIALVALAAIPVSASAHGSVFQSSARTIPTGWSYAGPGGSGLTTVTRYVLANHNYLKVLNETNAVTSGGMLDYKRFPGGYRNALRADVVDGGDAVFLSEAATGAQAHATCTGVASLSSTASILAWQGADPFYGYVPFQPNSAGLEDDPATWIDDVLAATGVDLGAITDTSTAPGSPLASACSGIGGTLVPADATQTLGDAFASGHIGDAVTAATEPLNTQITDLTTDKTTLQGTVAALTGAKTGLESEKSSLTASKAALGADNASLLKQLSASNKAKRKALAQVKSLKKQVAKLKKKSKN